MSKRICIILTIVLLAAMSVGVFAFAEDKTEIKPGTETETYTFYRRIDEEKHLVCKETWEYPIVDGERGSGKVIKDEEYEEAHTIVDGKCIYCDLIDKALVIAAPMDIEKTDDTEGSGDDPETFATVYDSIVAKGDGALAVLKQVFDALSDNARVIIGGVEAEAADALIALVKGDASADELMAVLSDFPTRTIDDVECRIVVLIVCDDWGEIIVENYAFSAADGTLVRVY